MSALLPHHPYLRFRIRLAHHGLLQFLASVKNSMEVTALVFAPVLLGLFATIALPGMFAVTLAWPLALAVLAAQALVPALPVLLLRKRLHPSAVLAWSRALPVPPALAWRADALVAAMLVGPLALAYGVSATVWLVQRPAWLQAVLPQALAATLATLLAGWLLATLVLARRRHGHAVSGARAAVAAPPAPYVRRVLDPLLPALWRRLFWLPFWRADSVVGLQQCALFAATITAMACWLLRPSWLHAVLPGAVWGMAASALLIVLTDRGDQAVREQIAVLRPVLAPWPYAAGPLLLCARLFSLLPAAAALLLFGALLGAANAPWSGRAVCVWIGTALAANGAIVALKPAPRGRVVLVMLSILILSAIGSELWK